VFFSSSKYSKTRFRPGLCPGPHWGSLQCSPDLLVSFSSPIGAEDSWRLRLLGISKFGQGPHFSDCIRASKVLIRHCRVVSKDRALGGSHGLSRKPFAHLHTKEGPKVKDFSDSLTPCPRQTASHNHDLPPTFHQWGEREGHPVDPCLDKPLH